MWFQFIKKMTNNVVITHEIYKSFDDGFEVRGVFLDISKAFDKVWHEDLIFKLKQNGTSGNLLNLLCDFEKCKTKSFVKWISLWLV